MILNLTLNTFFRLEMHSENAGKESVLFGLWNIAQPNAHLESHIDVHKGFHIHERNKEKAGNGTCTSFPFLGIPEPAYICEQQHCHELSKALGYGFVKTFSSISSQQINVLCRIKHRTFRCQRCFMYLHIYEAEMVRLTRPLIYIFDNY